MGNPTFFNRSKMFQTQLVESTTHDACITWRAGNGTILLQNVVRASEECTTSRINFWSSFIDMYYRGSGSSVRCCQVGGCNSGVANYGNRNEEKNKLNRLKFQFSSANDNIDVQTTGKYFSEIKS